MNDFVQLVQGVGFPVAVAAVLLWDRLTISAKLLALLSRIEKRLEGKETDRLLERER